MNLKCILFRSMQVQMKKIVFFLNIYFCQRIKKYFTLYRIFTVTIFVTNTNSMLMVALLKCALQHQRTNQMQ